MFIDGIILSSYRCILKTITVSKLLRLGGCRACHFGLAMRRFQSFLACLILITVPLEAAKEAWESCQKMPKISIGVPLNVFQSFFLKIVSMFFIRLYFSTVFREGKGRVWWV